MAAVSEPSHSYWMDTAPVASYPTLNHDLAVDVAVVGGGIVGLTAALLLKRAGRSVAVLEARQVGGVTTSRSTAKVTTQHNLIYYHLFKNFREAGAHSYAEANELGMTRIRDFIDELGIDCAFERKAAYAYTTDRAKLSDITTEVEAARRAGQPASFVDTLPLPFPIAGAVKFDNQAQFHPVRYTNGLAAAIDGDGCHVFLGTTVEDLDDGAPCRLSAGGYTVTARDVVVATHMPFIMQGEYFARAFPRGHLVLAAPIEDARAPDGMFISIDEPTHSLRTTPHPDGGQVLIALSSGFKTGQNTDTEAAYADLEAWARQNFGIGPVVNRWFNEDFDSMDRVPFIGPASPTTKHTWVATGFSSWGISAGTAAGMLLSDLIQGRDTPWGGVFDTVRAKPATSARKFVSENLGTARHLITGRLGREATFSLDKLPPGEAGVFDYNDEKVGVYRDDDGRLHTVSAVCPHLGCTVNWNNGERSWDCPCHGSRFMFDGSVVHGPAVTPLPRKDIAPE